MSIRRWSTILIVHCCFLLLVGGQQTTLASSGKIIAHFNTNVSYLTEVDPHFVSLSFEMGNLCDILGLDQQKPAYYEQLFKNLGTGVFRIGAHSADFSTYSPYGKLACSALHTTINQKAITDFFAFIERIHWKVIWGLDLIKYDPQMAATEASAVANIAGASLLAFAIGNEPDLFVKKNDRPAGWSYTDYKSEWETYYQQVLKAVPDAKFIGPDSCCETPFFYQFTQEEHEKVIATAHHYYTGQEEDIAYLLSKDVSEHRTLRMGQWTAAARQVGLPLMITESNTFSKGGVDGASNTYASALWAVDYLCEASVLGIKSVAFHNAATAYYDAIDINGAPTPLYYGLLLFHTLVQTPKSAIANVSLQTPLMVTAYEVMDGQKAARMLLMNRELKNDAEVEIQLDAPYKTMQLMRLTAPSIDAKNNITLGGSGISDQGTWSASKVESVEVNGASVSVKVPRGSAVEVSFG